MCSGASEFGPKIDELLKSITLFSTERHALELRNEWNTYLQNGYLLVFCLDIICMLWKGYTVCREHSALELNKKTLFVQFWVFYLEIKKKYTEVNGMTRAFLSLLIP